MHEEEVVTELSPGRMKSEYVKAEYEVYSVKWE
jgi:hypothetical protein